MFKNLTIGKKIGLGFGIVLALLIVVTVMAYTGVSDIVKVADQVITSNRLDGILAQKEVDHLNWANAVTKLFTDTSCSALNVQTDDHKCAFGEWLYGDGRAEAERAFPAIAPLLKEIEQPHGDLHRSAVEIAQTFRREHVGLRVTLANRYADHVAWAGKCASALASHIASLSDKAGEQPFTLGVETDPTKCAFGKFLAEPNTAKICAEFPEFKAAIDACREPHERLHGSAVGMERLVNEGQAQEAVRTLETDVQPALAEVKEHFNEAIAAESRLKEASAQGFAIYAERTRPALQKIQELLKQTREVLRSRAATDEVLLGAAQGAQRRVTVLGTLAAVLGALLAFLIARGIIRPLAHAIAGLTEGAQQVNAAASQISGAAQHLAAGASEQASSLEETSAALEQMAAMTRTCAENANQANELAATARTKADESDRTMGQLNTAMDAINQSSSQISKIIKVIEEIAFQTNLLALNAAVEAARAGEHGKGFAVVAEEVRNLAQRAAAAAKDTTNLIEGSVDRAKEGTTVAQSAAQALQGIVGDVGQVAELLKGISRASNEQAQGVEQVNVAVSQMDQVTQQNAAGAEESASAAEELSAQAVALNSVVAGLAALISGRRETVATTENATTTPVPASPAATQRKHFSVRTANLHATQSKDTRSESLTAERAESPGGTKAGDMTKF